MEKLVRWTLVTGGAGFLGSYLCEKLINEGFNIICVDNLTTGSLNNIYSLSTNPRFKFINHDIVNPLNLDSIDTIYNLACPASPLQYQRNPIQTLKTSVFGAVNMLDLCHRFNGRILHTSTSEIYGDPEVHPQPESYVGHVNPIGIRACYDEGKRAAETLFFDYFRQHHVPIKIVRLFNVYGPRMQIDDGRVIPNFILQALQNKSLTIHGDGEQTRSFCYVADIIDGMISLMKTDDAFTGPINLGSTYEVKIIELAKMIIDLVGSKSSIVFKPKLQDDPVRRRPDIKLAANQLGWSPTTLLDEGLKKTIAYFNELLSTNEDKTFSSENSVVNC